MKKPTRFTSWYLGLIGGIATSIASDLWWKPNEVKPIGNAVLIGVTVGLYLGVGCWMFFMRRPSERKGADQ